MDFRLLLTAHRRCAALLLVGLGLSAPVHGAVAPGDRGAQAYGAQPVPDGSWAKADQVHRATVLNVLDFGADPAPGNDDTDALIRAYDHVVNALRPYRAHAQKPFVAPSHVIYLPAGVYDLRRSLVYSGDPIDWEKDGAPRRTGAGEVIENLVNIRIVGEDRETTLLRLADDAKGFDDPGQPQAVVAFGRRSFNNVQAGNVLRNLTIDAGTHPGAIGVAFAGANNSGIRNVTVRGNGVAGLVFEIPPTQGYHQDITVQGFDVGLRVLGDPHVTHLSFEYLTLRSQRRAGIRLGGASLSLRAIEAVADPAVPLLRMDDDGGAAVLMDSRASGGILRNGGMLYVRDSVIGADRIGERLQLGTLTTAFSSLRLPVAEVPILPPALPADIAIVRSTDDGQGDDYEAFQAALSSGRSTLWLADAHYCLRVTPQRGPLQVPPHVTRIIGNFARIRSISEGDCSAPQRRATTLRVTRTGEVPLVVEDIESDGGMFLVNTTAREVMLRHVMTQGVLHVHDGPRARLHLVNVNGVGKHPKAFSGVDAWARLINTESVGEANFELLDTRMWVFGFKTEKLRRAFRLDDGALEVLGGLVNQFDVTLAPGGVVERLRLALEPTTHPPMFDVRAGQVSVLAVTDGPRGMGFDTFIQSADGEALGPDQFMARGGAAGRRFVTYTSAER